MSTQPNQPKTPRKTQHIIKWTVNPYRKDKRAGVISPVQMTPYTKYAFEEIERQFKD